MTDPIDARWQRIVQREMFDSTYEGKPRKTPPTLSLVRMVLVNAFWFGYQVYWFIMPIVVVPKQIEIISGSGNKGSGLAGISFYAGILNLFLAVLFGALYDRHALVFGKRRTFIVIGTVSLSTSLLLLSSEYSLAFYGVGYCAMTLSAIICSVSFNGLIADITPPEQKRTMSTIMASMSLAGCLVGAVVGVFVETLGIIGIYIVLVAILAATCLVTISFCEDERRTVQVRSLEPIPLKSFFKDLVAPFLENRDFRRVFISRFLFQLGIATGSQFLQYWIGDCVNTTMPSAEAVSLALIPLLVLAPIAAVCIPKMKRKFVVYVASGIMIATCVLLEVATELWMALLIGGLFGMGYGPFISQEFEILMDVLPFDGDPSKDIALWHSAMVLPQILAAPAAGWLLDYYQGVGGVFVPPIHCLGYKVTFSVCIIYFVVGAEITRRIEKCE
ncbi:major facilitator superfamily domain-containing protein [Chytriomyces cf. hyalinus JEL632]|nr:major facilitator superfamily domain-containing protein [Chytriomyces cf. hyalinus JEL632]